MLWKTISGGLIDLAGRWLTGRQRITEAKIEAEVITIKSQATIAELKAQSLAQLDMSKLEHAQAWERALVENSAKDWKDEWWTILVSIPLVMAFVPGFQQYTVAGFDNLEDLPEWYLYVVFAAVSFAFARRSLLPMLRTRLKP